MNIPVVVFHQVKILIYTIYLYSYKLATYSQYLKTIFRTPCTTKTI